MQEQEPLIGVAGIIIKDDKVLFGKRKGDHGEGTWGLPGGKLEFGEALGECCLREIREETSLDVRLVNKDNIETYTNNIFPDGQHFVTLYLKAEYIKGIPKVMEPEKCEMWEWFKWNKPPTPLFIPVQNLFDQTYDPFEHNPFAAYRVTALSRK